MARGRGPDEIRESPALALDARIRVPVARTFPMAKAAAALVFMEQRSHVGRIVLTGT